MPRNLRFAAARRPLRTILCAGTAASAVAGAMAACGGGGQASSTNFMTGAGSGGVGGALTGGTGAGTGGTVVISTSQTAATTTTATTGTASGGGGQGGHGAGPECLGVASSGPLAWAQGYGDGSNHFGEAIATDPAGNVFVTGGFGGSMTLGQFTLTSGGSTNVFLAKLDPTGTVVWAKGFSSAKSQSGRGVATDAAGDVYLVGSFLGTVDFGGGALTAQGCCFNDVFLAKFDGAGNPIWSKSFGDQADQVGRAVTVDPQGNVIISGDFEANIDFGGGASLTSVDGYDAFVAAFDGTGTPKWAHAFPGPTNQSALALVADATGAIDVVGEAATSIDLGGGALAVPGMASAWVAQLDGTGAPVWGHIYGNGTVLATAVRVDSARHLHLAGDYTGTVDLGGGSLAADFSPRVFVAELDDKGKHVWSRGFGDDQSHHATGVAVDGKGRTLVTGFFQGAIQFGGSKLTSAGNFDVFVARLDTMGCQVWAQRFGDSAYQSAAAITTDAQGSAIITGEAKGMVDFGKGALPTQGDDLYVAKFAE